jgi:peptidoglycan hydrolase-like protein with peptidoglycan-binding domain
VAALAAVSIPAFAYADTLNRDLVPGMSGADVSALQSFLATRPAVYPQGLVTGYYGFLTEAAVSNFQVNNGIDGVGTVGPITLPVLNLQISQGAMASGGVSTMNGGNVANGTVYTATANNSVTGTGGTAPIITNVAISTARNSATVTWNTDQAATGVVYYNTSPLNLNASLTNVGVSGGYSAMTDSSFRNFQSVSLSNLAANTTYYYMVYTTDQGGNVSVSWPSTFQTTN